MSDRPVGEGLRIVIADDHPLFRVGLKLTLTAQGFTVAAEATDGEQALAACLQHAPDVALLDVKMPALSGIDVCERLSHLRPDLPVVLISTFSEPAIIAAAKDAGARAYLSKETEPTELARMLRRVATEPRADYLPRADVPRLTPRERDVLALLAQGHSNKEIARLLGLSPDTVKDYMGRLFDKFGANDRLGVLNKARALGLV